MFIAAMLSLGITTYQTMDLADTKQQLKETMVQLNECKKDNSKTSSTLAPPSDPSCPRHATCTLPPM